MQAANRVQRALKSGKPTFGAWQGLPGTNHSRTIVRTPHLDWICLDCEHGQLSDHAMHESVAAIAACGVSPIVRVPEGQHWMIKRALDAGTHGIIVPLLNSVQDARDIVKYSKFPPRGNRGLGSGLSMEKFAVPGAQGEGELSLGEYYQQANDATVVIAQIETKGALEQVRDIAAVEGVDVLFVGPVDLGNSIGHPSVVTGQNAPELDAAIERVRDAAREAGKWSAIYTASGEAAKSYAGMGFDMVCAANDIAVLRRGFGEQFRAANGGV